MSEAGDKIRCIMCEAEGIGTGFAHDCALILRVEPNDDPILTCFLCGRETTQPPELRTEYYSPHGSTVAGLHRRCYDRARVRNTKLDLSKVR